jgi:hypothetical protein
VRLRWVVNLIDVSPRIHLPGRLPSSLKSALKYRVRRRPDVGKREAGQPSVATPSGYEELTFSSSHMGGAFMKTLPHSISGHSHGKRESEGRALTHAAFYAYLPPLGFDQSFYNG